MPQPPRGRISAMARTYQIITLFSHDTMLHNVSLALLGFVPATLESVIDLTGTAICATPRAKPWRKSGSPTVADRPLSQTSYGERRRRRDSRWRSRKIRKSCCSTNRFAGLSHRRAARP